MSSAQNAVVLEDLQSQPDLSNLPGAQIELGRSPLGWPTSEHICIHFLTVSSRVSESMSLYIAHQQSARRFDQRYLFHDVAMDNDDRYPPDGALLLHSAGRTAPAKRTKYRPLLSETTTPWYWPGTRTEIGADLSPGSLKPILPPLSSMPAEMNCGGGRYSTIQTIVDPFTLLGPIKRS